MNTSILKSIVAVTAVAMMAGCTMKDQDAPPISGPSEFGTSVVVSADQDILPLDGSSRAVITIRARNSSGQPLGGLTLRAEIRVNGTPIDFGSLAPRSVTTLGNGEATVVYTAPVAPPVGVDEGIIIDIVITPVNGDFNNAAPRSIAIRLIPPGTVIPPSGLVPSFTFTPTQPQDNQTVLFDASASQPVGGIAEFTWNFGDGGTATGRTATHAFGVAGSYAVTLTIVDSFNRAASTTQSVTVGAGLNPVAAFTFSPTTPLIAQSVFFNASTSRPAPGRTIVSYQWDFGDGSPLAEGQQTSHIYGTQGTYTVTLVVTDDGGRFAAVSQTVNIGSGAPTADFTFSPTSPVRFQVVNFNATPTAAPGRTIVSFFWSFGDGSNGAGQTVGKAYTTAGSFNVTLTVTDNTGASASVTKAITIAP
jgi:PKD repeat protein